MIFSVSFLEMGKLRLEGSQQFPRCLWDPVNWEDTLSLPPRFLPTLRGQVAPLLAPESVLPFHRWEN